jgi:hypothetical protein
LFSEPRAEILLPQESSFVVAARESIPIPGARLTTAMTRGRASVTPRGRGRNSGTEASKGRGRGTSKKNKTTTDDGPSTEDGACTVASEASRGRGRGRGLTSKRKAQEIAENVQAEQIDGASTEASRGRGRGRGSTSRRKSHEVAENVQAEPTDGAITDVSTDMSRRSETSKTGPGLFGHDQARARKTSIPDLNDICQGVEEEIELTQNAPHPNE